MLTLNKVVYDYHQTPFEFDLHVEGGQILALMGASGAGKSTLLSLIAGFISPIEGDITIDGQSILSLQPHQRPLSMLFQEHNLFSHLTVAENIGLGLHPGLKLSSSQKQQINIAAEQVGIENMIMRLPQALSGGQRQRVALARCFVQPHSIWLLDEPFSALDPILRIEMLTLVKRLAVERNITVIMVTHHLNDARAIASHFAFMEQGKVLICDDINELTLQHPHPSLQAFVGAAEG